jgi:hypothetical protein
MVDRFLVWLGAGMVTAGVAAAMVAGAGVGRGGRNGRRGRRGDPRPSSGFRRQRNYLVGIGETD